MHRKSRQFHKIFLSSNRRIGGTFRSKESHTFPKRSAELEVVIPSTSSFLFRHIPLRFIVTKSFSSVEPKKMKLGESEDFHALFTPELKLVQGLFEQNGFELRIAGGAVRDLLMGKRPADVDFATTATPQEMNDIFEKEKIRTLNVKGAEKHGTVTCRINDKENFEITTLRIDVTCDGRRAEVVWTRDWYKDAERRDLTINSLFLGLDGTVYDYFNGVEDIKKKRVAFVKDPQERIREDYLRILRYFRFFGRIVDNPESHEPETLAAIKANAEGLAGVSGERIWSELKKILVGNYAGPIVRTMVEACELGPRMGFPSQPNLSRLEEKWNQMRAAGLEWKPMTLLAAMFETEEEVTDLNNRLKVSKVEKTQAEFIVRYRNEYKSEANSAKFFQDLLLDEKPEKIPENRERICQLLVYLSEKDLLAHMEKWETPVYPVSGFDIIKKGVKKGPAMTVVNTHLFNVWKRSDYKATTAELLEHCFDPEIPPPPSKKRKKSGKKSP